MKLEENEIKILGEYKFIGDEFMRSQKNRNENETLLCIRENEKGYRHLDKVQTKDATSWEIFKSYFGYGKLAGCDLSMEVIAGYLAKKDLSWLDCETPAYATVHAVAARVLIYRKPYQELWKKLSTSTQSFQIQHVNRECSSRHKDDYDWILENVHRALLITPKTRIGHLIAQVDDLESRSWDRWNGPQSTEAKKWAAWGEGYKPRYHVLARAAPADEKNLKDLFFHIIDRVNYRFVAWRSHNYETITHSTL